MRNRWNQLLFVVLACFSFGFTGCETMKNFGNSMAFWKSSPPQDQFATNSPTASFSPTAPGTAGFGQNNGLNATQPGSYPFGNSAGNPPGYRGNVTAPYSNGPTTQPSIQNSPNSAGNGFRQNLPGNRAPYSTSQPTPNRLTTPNALQGNQFRAQPSNSNTFNTSSSGTFGNQPSGNQPSGTQPLSTPTYGAPNSPGLNTPSGEFRSQSGGFQTAPASGKYVPNTNLNGSSVSRPAPGNSPAARTGSGQPSASSNWKDYPKTAYPGFGASSSSSGFQPKSANPQPESKNVQASGTLTPPSSVPPSIFDKKGQYAPGSTGSGGKASNAGFESRGGLYAPTTGSKIPASSGLYSPQ